MLHPQRKTMDLVPLVCLCLLTWSAGTAADHKPVVVYVELGSDVVLPCSLSTQQSLTYKHFEWKKDQKQVFLYDAGSHSNNIVDKFFDWQKDGQKKKEVFVYEAGDHYNNGRIGQDQQFKGRVFYFEDQLKNGNASIQISNTQLNDSGNYTCDFPRLQPPQTFHIKLVVEPVVVNVEPGSDVILPCSLSTQQSLTSGFFEWKKDQKQVFKYDSGVHSNNNPTGQDKQFKDRVFYFSDQLRNGNASIQIRNTQLADSGNYTCDFPRLQPPQTFYIKLVFDGDLKDRSDKNIGGAAPKPSVTILDATTNWVLLYCEGFGDPLPELEWKDSAGNTLPAERPQVSDRGGRPYITVKTTVTKTDNFSCAATQKTIYHTISNNIYVRLNEKTSNNWTGVVIGIVGAVFGIVGIVLAVRARSERSNTAANRSHGGLSPDNDNSEPNQQRGENNGLLPSPETKSASKDQDNTPV